MKKQKTKFKDITITLNKKELKLLTFMIGNTTYSDCEFLVKQGDISYDLYKKLNTQMVLQDVTHIDKYIDFEITEQI